MQKTRMASVVLILVILAMMALSAVLMCDIGKAQAETEQKAKTTAELFSETNTYNCSVVGDGKNDYDVQYDLTSSGKNNNKVMDIPQITVLTHGLGGKASDWSNQYNGDKIIFEFDEISLVEKLKEKSNDSYIYRVKMISSKSYELYLSYNTAKENVSEITDISKHIIVVFEADAPLGSNNSVYYEFNNAISSIVLQVKKLNGGILPKLNLIGHSRGGLTNMQYALDHPDMVDSLISIGTPYFSSNMANVFGNMIMDDCDGLDDILDKDIYMNYYRRWNNNYDSLYKNINAVAIGGYSSLTMLPIILTKDKSGVIESYGLNKEARIAVAAALEVVFAYALEIKATYLSSTIILSMLTRALNAVLPQDKVVDIMTLLASEIGFTYKPPFTAYFGDLLVPLDSQLGIENGIELINIHEYKGFKRYKRYFNEFNSNFDKVAEAMPPAVHNLEPRDAQIIQWVCNEVNMGQVREGFQYKNIDDNSIEITGYYGRYDSQKVTVPTQIDGFSVVAIDDNAFNESWFSDNMTTIVLPKSIISIGESAFADCKVLQSVELDGDNLLTDIGNSAFAGCINLDSLPNIREVRSIADGAFAGTAIEEIDFAQYPWINSIGAGAFRECKNLKRVSFGSNITDIGEYAFYGCDNLTTVIVPQGIVEIGVGAFACCLSMTHINVDSLNQAYKSISGVLYSKDGKTVYQYPAAQAGYMYVLPDGVNEIADYAFACNSMSEIRLNKNLRRIGKYAFYSNGNLTDIIVYDDVRIIDSFAFADCSSLTKVTLFNPNSNHLSDWSFENINSDAQFYVTYYALSKDFDKQNMNKSDYYTDRFALADYKDNLNPIEYIINYYDGNKLIDTQPQYYLAENKKYAMKEGYDFYCWQYKGTETLYNSADNIINEEINLQAKWGVKEYIFKFYRLNKDGKNEFGYLSIVNGIGDIVMQPTKVEYGAKATEQLKEKLMNWYYNEGRYYEGQALVSFKFSDGQNHYGGIALGGQEPVPDENLVGDSVKLEDNYDYSAVYAFVESLIDDGVKDFGDIEEIHVEPEFRSKKVEFNFNSNGGELLGNTGLNKLFGDLSNLPIPERWGYSFLGWQINVITAVSDKYDTSKLPKFTSSNNSYIGKIYNFSNVPDLIYKIPFDYSINLVAQWKYDVIDAYAETGSEINVNGGNTKWLDFSRYQELSVVNKTVKVASTVSKLYVRYMFALENISFIILGDCTLVLEGCLFIASSDKCGINASNTNLKIISIGTNLISGGKKSIVRSSDPADNSAGVVAKNLTVEAITKSNEFLSINGGNGADATSAGAKGGQGGVGIYASNARFISGIVHVFGGKGGKGGKGADGKFANPAKKGGKGGTGGKGGDGGVGIFRTATATMDEDTICAFGGNGGKGGEGGAGGSGGKKYLTNNHAETGDTGKKGSPGEYGVDYYD